MAALDVDALKTRVTTFLKGFSPSQLVIIGLLTVVAVVGGTTFLKWVTAPTYGVLLAGLDAQDASAVIAKLEADGVAYELSSGGSTIMVPTSVMDQERLAVAAEGLPAGKTDSGWAPFDKVGPDVVVVPAAGRLPARDGVDPVRRGRRDRRRPQRRGPPRAAREEAVHRGPQAGPRVRAGHDRTARSTTRRSRR